MNWWQKIWHKCGAVQVIEECKELGIVRSPLPTIALAQAKSGLRERHILCKVRCRQCGKVSLRVMFRLESNKST
jgi:hypothetical protein